MTEVAINHIDAKKAVEIAVSYFCELWQIPKYDVRLEEVDLQNEKMWAITISIPKKASETMGISLYTGSNMVREFKIIKIDAKNGTVSSVKIRE